MPISVFKGLKLKKKKRERQRQRKRKNFDMNSGVSNINVKRYFWAIEVRQETQRSMNPYLYKSLKLIVNYFLMTSEFQFKCHEMYLCVKMQWLFSFWVGGKEWHSWLSWITVIFIVVLMVQERLLVFLASILESLLNYFYCINASLNLPNLCN